MSRSPWSTIISRLRRRASVPEDDTGARRRSRSKAASAHSRSSSSFNSTTRHERRPAWRSSRTSRASRTVRGCIRRRTTSPRRIACMRPRKCCTSNVKPSSVLRAEKRHELLDSDTGFADQRTKRSLCDFAVIGNRKPAKWPLSCGRAESYHESCRAEVSRLAEARGRQLQRLVRRRALLAAYREQPVGCSRHRAEQGHGGDADAEDEPAATLVRMCGHPEDQDDF